jgi:cytidyltransferase-like protein
MTTLNKVYTTGVFDLLHYGHINFLNRASAFGNLIVGLVDDNAVSEYKGKGRPILPYAERYELLSSLKCVTDIVKQETFEPNPNFKIDIIIKGADQDHIGEEYATKNNIPIVRLSRTEGVSTSQMIRGMNG